MHQQTNSNLLGEMTMRRRGRRNMNNSHAMFMRIYNVTYITFTFDQLDNAVIVNIQMELAKEFLLLKIDRYLYVFIHLCIHENQLPCVNLAKTGYSPTDLNIFCCFVCLNTGQFSRRSRGAWIVVFNKCIKNCNRERKT